MSDNERRIIDYDAFNDLPPNSWLIVDSEGQGTGKIAPIKIGATYEIQDGAHSFTLVGSNGYTHTVDIPYDSVQMSYEDYQALTEVQKMDGTNRFVPDVPTDDLEPEIWQRVGRTPLATVEKTISPAINELKGRIDDSDGEIADIKSNLIDLETIDTLYDDNNILLQKIGKLYVLYFTGCTASNLTTALSTILNYTPSDHNVHHTLFTSNNGVNYLANGNIQNSGQSFSVNVVGTYGNAPSNFFNTQHSLYGTMMWVK